MTEPKLASGFHERQGTRPWEVVRGQRAAPDESAAPDSMRASSAVTTRRENALSEASLANTHVLRA